jgi:hypothetical protein
MDLNVKLQELKYNFGKVQGCFCKITMIRFSRIFRIILLKKNPWNNSTIAWTGSMGSSSRVYGPHETTVVGY